jgi:hypothetical protein
MDILAALLKEHSKHRAINIATYACLTKEHFKQVIDCFLDSEYRCAASCMECNHSCKARPEMIKLYIPILVAQLTNGEAHTAVIRNAVRILQEIEIPEALHGKVMDACFKFIESPTTPVAIKAFSLTTLSNLAKIYPEIQPELKLIIEERIDNETAAFKNRGKKILSVLKII